MAEQRRRGKNGSLLAALERHSEALRATLQMLREPAPAVFERVPWSDVKKAAEQIHKEATTSGMLWSGTPTAQEASEKFESYVNQLQGFLLMCHGTTVGAGPTLLSNVQNNSKQVLESSLALLKSALSIETQAARQEALPPLAGCVWEACECVLKAPADNRTAIGRGIVQVGTSIKDVLREMNEIELDEGAVPNDDGGSRSSVDSATEFLNFDVKLSPAEMEVADMVKDMISAVLVVVRQVLYVVSKAQDDGSRLQNLENILEHVKNIGGDIDELGASVYPPQEMEQLKEMGRKIDTMMKQVSSEVLALHGSVPEGLSSACEKAHESHAVFQDNLARVNLGKDLQDLKLN